MSLVYKILIILAFTGCQSVRFSKISPKDWETHEAKEYVKYKSEKLGVRYVDYLHIVNNKNSK
jgi:uncharacterized protein YceK